MSTSLLEHRRPSLPTRFRAPTIIDERVELMEPRLRLANQSVTSDEEVAFVTKIVMWMLFLGITPLILFLTVNYFHPELFLTPTVPN